MREQLWPGLICMFIQQHQMALMSPASLVMMAKEQGLLGMALTDHDTVDGISEAAAKAKKIDFPLIAGIEFPSEQNERDVHILGYWFDPEKISAQ